MRRHLEVLEIPTGERLVELLPRLQAALRGEGHAILPVPAGHPAEAGRLVTALAGGTELAEAEDDPADPTAVVVTTSGSTGAPKGALLPVSALVASADATRCRLTCTGGLHPHRSNGRRRAPAPTGTWLLTLPGHHIAGLQVLFRAIAEGTTPVIMDTAGSFTTQAFTGTVSRMPAGRRFVSLVPTQLHRILAEPEATAALATFSAVLVGGAATPQALVDDARQAGVPIITTYGMSETCGGCVYDGVPLDQVAVSIEDDEPRWDQATPWGWPQRYPHGSGAHQANPSLSAEPAAQPADPHPGDRYPRDPPAADPHLSGLDAADRHAAGLYAAGLDAADRHAAGLYPADARPGRVSISGPMVARGYRDMPRHPSFWHRPDDLHRTFITDDLAVMNAGRLSIVGRIDDVIVTGGVKVDPAVVETVLFRVAGVAQVVITGVPDDEWGTAVVAVVQPDAGTAPDLTTLRAAAVYAQGPAAAPKHLVLVDHLPYRGPGKPDRPAVRELALRRIGKRNSRDRALADPSPPPTSSAGPAAAHPTERQS